MIDLSSDTATQPTLAMKQAMMAAPLGDEQKGLDPTTHKLEQTLASLLGHNAAIFLPSATMANQIALQLHCERGDEMIAAENCHIFISECGGSAIHANVQAKPIPTENGIFSAEDIYNKYRWLKTPLTPITKLVSIENTTNMGGGIPWSKAELNSILSTAKELNLKTHLDGSRLFNAAAATHLSPKEIASEFDSITLCFSKGLGCAVGAALVFDQQHFAKVRRLKQLMGGSMRQSGILAAGCLYALEHHIERLQEDHENAKLLAEGLSSISLISVENKSPATNMVFFSLQKSTPEDFEKLCSDQGIRFSRVGKNRFRAVTHLGVSREEIEMAIKKIKNMCRVD